MGGCGVKPGTSQTTSHGRTIHKGLRSPKRVGLGEYSFNSMIRKNNPYSDMQLEKCKRDM
jgi:hypothetical protein